jgi:hypothetical protein
MYLVTSESGSESRDHNSIERKDIHLLVRCQWSSVLKPFFLLVCTCVSNFFFRTLIFRFGFDHSYASGQLRDHPRAKKS